MQGCDEALACLVDAAEYAVNELGAIAMVYDHGDEVEDALATCSEQLAEALFAYKDAAYRRKEDTI